MGGTAQRFLGREYQPRAHRRADHFFRHLGPGDIVKSIATAMRGHDVIRIDGFECEDSLANIVVRERGHEVHAADDGMDLLNAGYSLCPLYGVDHTTMAARG